jgi:hypothetical protein
MYQEECICLLHGKLLVLNYSSVLGGGHLRHVSLYLKDGESKFSGGSVSSKFMLFITSNFPSIFQISVDRRI